MFGQAIWTARLADELLRYSAGRRDIFDGAVQAIRTPRGAVRVGNELFMATNPKEPAHVIMERLGFTGQTAVAFPEEMLRFEGAEEEPEYPVIVTADGEVAVASVGLPASWVEKGLTIPSPPEGLDDVKRLVYAEGTGIPLEKWEERLKDRRKKLSLVGDADRGFQWSTQDFFVIASITLSNVLFMHQEPTGALKIDKWIQPPNTAGALKQQQMYMILWGPRELLVTRGKVYRFLTKDLPADLLTALDGASPIPEEEAKGVVGPLDEEEEQGAAAPPPAVQNSAAEAVVAPVVASVVDTVAAAGGQVAAAADAAAESITDALKGLTATNS